ncbi:MAG: ABC transporter ATP-binding protein [Oscillospiraceae bacterium]|nr:ABC transporter ATP-binding protein [Oscillospiraceae bacterium]
MQIAISDISKKYGRKTVLSGASFTAQSSECVGILGVNGSGKSTLLSVLAGVLKPDGGTFLCDGTDLFRAPSVRSKTVGFVPQGTPLIEELSAKDNLSLWYDRESMQRELDGGTLSLLGIDEFLNVRVSRMSGGMKKRLSIGCAIAKKPQLLLLDEPMSALDLVCKQNIKDYLNAYKKDGGILILVTHDVLELELCDRCYLLKDGKLCPFTYSGDTEQLVKELL